MSDAGAGSNGAAGHGERRSGRSSAPPSSSASAAGSPPTRRSRSAAASSTPAPTSRRCSPRARRASSARRPSRRSPPSRPASSCSARTDPIPHTDLGQRADLVVVAPATARVIGAYAAGISSDLLVATLLATRAPVLVCPAMHTEMWEHPAVQENLATLRRRGVHVARAGDRSPGRRGRRRRAPAEPPSRSSTRRPASGRASRRARSCPAARRSARARHRRRHPGADRPGALSSPTAPRASRATPSPRSPPSSAATVTLVTTTALPAAPGVEVVEVETAAEMADAVLAAAASSRRRRHGGRRRRLPARQSSPTAKLHKADGRPRSGSTRRSTSSPSSGAGGVPGRCSWASRPRPTTLAERAAAKLEAKDVDLVVANDVAADGVGFAHDTNAVTIFDRGRGPDARSPCNRNEPSREPSSTPPPAARPQRWRPGPLAVEELPAVADRGQQRGASG